MERVLRVFGSESGKQEAGYEPLQLDELADSRVSTDTAVRIGTAATDDDDAMSTSPPPPISRAAFAFWIGVNVAATLSIIFANKLVLSSGRLSGSKTLFIAYHFALTGLTLQLAAVLKALPAKAAPVLAILPLALIFAARTSLPLAPLPAADGPILHTDTVVTNWSLVHPLSLQLAELH